MNKRIKKIVIVGGGTAGWMTAASLAKHFEKIDMDISLVDSSQIATVGVGEATIPSIRRFYKKLGMTDHQVMKETQATAKLGIKFIDWYEKGKEYLHPFGLHGQTVNNVPFHHYWMKLKSLGDTSEFGEYSLAVNLANNNKFSEPVFPSPTELSIFDWALHFDATLFAGMMKRFSLENNVKHIDSKITNVNLDPDTGFIKHLDLENGTSLEGELFIDCSGFRGVLIEQALQTGYEDWSHYLKCDKAIAVQTELTGEPVPYTATIAQEAGWRWKIPLQHRQGNGHVFSSRYITEQQALDTLLEKVTGKLITEPRVLNFTPGRRKKAWNKNCIAVGLASGFLEPLESTSIALVETAIDKIKMLFPSTDFNESVIDEFNDMTKREYERVRDFIILHYKANNRSDTEFWKDCRAGEIPQTLQHKIDLFVSQGHFVKYRWEIFQPASWVSIFMGNNMLPETYDLSVDNMDEDYLKDSLQKMRQSLKNVVGNAGTHAEYIAKYCSSSK